MLDDTLDLANKLFATGPAPTFIVYSGVPHSFIGMTRILPQAQEARTDLVQALRRNLAA